MGYRQGAGEMKVSDYEVLATPEANIISISVKCIIQCVLGLIDLRHLQDLLAHSTSHMRFRQLNGVLRATTPSKDQLLSALQVGGEI